ncbi:MAG TPA: alpha/beta hydrolase [Nitrospiria bacterium]
MNKPIHFLKPAPEETWLTTTDGLKLFTHSHLPKIIKGHLCVIHGLSEHSGRYTHLIEYFLPLGYAVHLMDQRGFGRSQGLRGHVDRYVQYLDDLNGFIKHVQNKFSHGKTFLIGHSLGGVIASAFAMTHDSHLEGIILSAPGLRIRNFHRSLYGVVKILNWFKPNLQLRHTLRYRHLSHDPSVGKAYIQDPLVHPFITPRFFLEFNHMLSFVHRNPHRLHLPCLILCPTGDRIVNPQGSIEFYQNLKNPLNTLITYPGFFHEIFSEVRKEQVFSDVKSWLETVKK